MNENVMQKQALCHVSITSWDNNKVNYSGWGEWKREINTLTTSCLQGNEPKKIVAHASHVRRKHIPTHSS